ncbi:RNA polymerase sigma-70 factor (ECF subfamily) [Paenibacillus sp. JGP012]|uniref:sigma-70 family RNA polymerase sigma factor n=1 Tax=Paenibacillus sp. JGP012 TaxID=2735914 RepID=UPI0017D401B8|nr:sigma-70 family RNA polymerase sigma factor [Paenibacillus sp. JGP012]MBB6020350.1 RNA polymerase sigma-70 factor (ECF subfamily) [Paenibacillus sp. JGP012]
MHQTMEQEVKRAQQGDREAFIQLFRRLEPELYSLAKSIVGRDEDCADALQETTLKAYKGITGLRNTAYFKTWLIRILINECNQVLRMRKRTVVMAELPEQTETRGNLTHFVNSRQQDLREAVENLDESLRLVIHLFYYQDLPIKQIASVLEMSEGAVKARLHRARGVLAKQMNWKGESAIEST